MFKMTRVSPVAVPPFTCICIPNPRWIKPVLKKIKLKIKCGKVTSSSHPIHQGPKGLQPRLTIVNSNGFDEPTTNATKRSATTAIRHHSKA